MTRVVMIDTPRNRAARGARAVLEAQKESTMETKADLAAKLEKAGIDKPDNWGKMSLGRARRWVDGAFKPGTLADRIRGRSKGTEVQEAVKREKNRYWADRALKQKMYRKFGAIALGNKLRFVQAVAMANGAAADPDPMTRQVRRRKQRPWPHKRAA